MTHFESQQISVNCSDKKIFDFLCDFNNFGKLVPSQITNWSSDLNNCAFSIEGMADVEMKIGEKIPYSLVSFISKEKTPFPFSIDCSIVAIDDQNTYFKVDLSAKLNPFIKIMAERPLRNLVNHLTDKLKEVAENSL